MDFKLAHKLNDEWERSEVNRKMQECFDHLFALQLSAKWKKEDLAAKISRGSGARKTEQECIICFEKPKDPVGCCACRQLIGCRSCVRKWRSLADSDDLNRLLSDNHNRCPLCRTAWIGCTQFLSWENLRRFP